MGVGVDVLAIHYLKGERKTLAGINRPRTGLAATTLFLF